jgi:hypothetical protein
MGEYRAPKSRASLRDYWWFCLEHVRGYNAAWDYYRGMSPAQIEMELRRDTAWQRPSWPLGRLGAAAWDQEAARDPLGVLEAGRLRRKGRGHAAAQKAPAELREPLAALGLSWPDTNGGDRAAEERFKAINLAYAAVRSRLSQDPEFAAAG